MWPLCCFSGLQASLLVRHPDTGELYVNCDPQLIQLIRETECMMKMNLPIPETARLLYLRRNVIKSLADELKVKTIRPHNMRCCVVSEAHVRYLT